MTDRCRPRPCLPLFLCLVLLCLAAPVHAARVEGVVFSHQGPVAGATVTAFPDYASSVKNEGGVTSTPGEKPGQFFLDVPAGSYIFIARSEQAGSKLFSYHGINPITIEGDYRWLPFFAVAAKSPERKAGPTGIGGQVFYDGAPLGKGVVSVYSLQDKQFRGMGLLTNTLDEEGRFWFGLEPGSYVIIARHRQSGNEMGPLNRGDLFCYPAGNPLQVEDGQSTVVSIECYPRDNLEAFLDEGAADPRGRRESQRRSASLWKKSMRDAEGIPAGMATRPALLSGQVTTPDGRPAAGLYITAYPADNFPLFEMYALRLITRDMTRTDSEGRYRLELTPGMYYLVAREKLGVAPEPEELYGLYEGNSNHSITLSPGGEATADMTVVRILP